MATVETKKTPKASPLKADGTPKKSLGGRPRKRVVNTIDRSKRVPLSGFRSIMEVQFHDPNFRKQWHPYWFIDSGEEGQEIWRAKQAGYDFVLSHEADVGETYVFKSQNVGTVIRLPSKDGRYHFLMKKPLHEYEEDKAKEMQHKVDSYEQQVLNPQGAGVYGGIKVSNNEKSFY